MSRDSQEKEKPTEQETLPKDALARVPDSIQKDSLVQLAEFAVERRE